MRTSAIGSTPRDAGAGRAFSNFGAVVPGLGDFLGLNRPHIIEAPLKTQSSQTARRTLPKVYGFYLGDEPDPTGRWGTQVSPENLKAEPDWIHSHIPDAKTFITMMNMGSVDNPAHTSAYSSENTHIDLFGIDWYPVWSDTTTSISTASMNTSLLPRPRASS
jgi:hypothetical protein